MLSCQLYTAQISLFLVRIIKKTVDIIYSIDSFVTFYFWLTPATHWFHWEICFTLHIQSIRILHDACKGDVSQK